MNGQPVRLCGGCNGVFLGDDRNEIYLCVKCTRRAWSGFDPQPSTTCRSLAGRELVVLSRVGQVLTVRPVGRPDLAPWETSVFCVKPVSISPGR